MVRILSRAGIAAGLGLGLALGLAACSIPQTAFQPSVDGGGSGSMSNVLAIVVSRQAVELDEGASADFTVKLNQAPTSPLEIDLSSTSQKLGLSMQKLFFDANNFAKEQAITVTGQLDDDTATELAEVKLAGTGVADVTVGATVHDNDKVVIQSDANANGITVGEATSTDVHVHLTHRPPGDVSITATMSNGPVTVSPPARVIHMTDDFTRDVTFTLSAPIDANVANELQTVTFEIAGVDQKIFMVQDIDRDTLAISASPTSIAHLREGDSVTLNLTLTKQPAAALTVNIATTTGQAQIGSTSVTFQPTGNDYLTNHPVTITAPQDANVTPENDTIKLSVSSPTGVVTVNVPVQIDDDDVQAIQTTVTNSLTVTEGSGAQFDATLRFAPTGNFTVNLSSMDSAVATVAAPGGANFLTFTPTDYNDASMHQVIVTGTQDNNLVANATVVKLIAGTLETDVNVDVRDDDTQAFTVSQTTALSVPEGGSKSFTARLAFQPTTAVTALFTSTDPALQVSPASADFTSATWNMPVTVTVTAPVDKNNQSESATISVASSPTSPAVPTASFTATVADATVVNTWGWPAPPPFLGSSTVNQGQVVAYRVNVPTASLDVFGVFVPTAAGDYRMALYTDAGGTPGSLVSGAQFARRTLANGANVTDISDINLTAGNYWIALRVGSTTGLSTGDPTAGQTGLRCTRQFNIPNLDDVWPVTFGTADCSNNNLFNFWITTYHQ